MAFRPARGRQVAALCWRRRPGGGALEILLVTTRRSGRWTPPKGGLMKGKTEAESAAEEAWEEAGASGAVSDTPLGDYPSLKYRSGKGWEKWTVALYPLEVDSLADQFDEKGQRELRWFSQAEAPAQVRERALRRLIAGFRP